MDDSNKVRIAVSGHADSGKTTLVRTLLKREVGRIADEVDTTTIATPYKVNVDDKISHLPARFGEIIDCPGLQNAQVILDHETKLAPFTQAVKEDDRAKYPLDFRALDAIGEADVALYVATLETVPGSAHIDELKLVRSRCSRVIAILNQYNVVAGSKGVEKADNRVRSWTTMVQEQGVTSVITFDAHWDSPAKLADIYQAINQLLPDEKSTNFQLSIEDLRNLITVANRNGFKRIGELVADVRSIHEDADSHRYDYDCEKAKNELAALVQDKAAVHLKKFLEHVVKEYTVAADPGTPSVNLHSSSVEESAAKLRGAAAGGAIGASIGGLATAIGILVFPPAAALVPVILAAGTGTVGTIGVVVGRASTRPNSKVDVKPSAVGLHDIAKLGLAIFYGVSHQGFGKASEVNKKTLSALVEFVAVHEQPVVLKDWAQASLQEIIEWCEQTCQRMEQSKQVYLLDN